MLNKWNSTLKCTHETSFLYWFFLQCESNFATTLNCTCGTIFSHFYRFTKYFFCCCWYNHVNIEYPIPETDHRFTLPPKLVKPFYYPQNGHLLLSTLTPPEIDTRVHQTHSHSPFCIWSSIFLFIWTKGRKLSFIIVTAVRYFWIYELKSRIKKAQKNYGHSEYLNLDFEDADAFALVCYVILYY